MTAFFAIAALTVKSAVRSKVFRVLLFLLVLTVILIPNTIKGDGSAAGFIQIILEYSMAFSAFILSVSAVWLCCSEICSDVESGQISMTAVKPVSRMTILAGKFSGVVAIHACLLVLASAVVYAFVMLNYAQSDLPKSEKVKLDNEIFTARRIFAPVTPDFDALAEKELSRRATRAAEMGQETNLNNAASARNALAGIVKELKASFGEVPAGRIKYWDYDGLPEKLGEKDLLFVRYRMFMGSNASKNENATLGMWRFRGMVPSRTAAGADGKTEYVENMLQLEEEEMITSVTREFPLPAELAVHNGTAKIGFVNLNRNGSAVNFQMTDGPFLMLKQASFLSNYLRNILVVLLGIIALSTIAAAFAAFTSTPTSVFMTGAYVVVCFFSSYVLKAVTSVSSPDGISEHIGGAISRVMTLLLIPVQDFFITSKLAGGELIEFSYIGNLVFFDIILRGLPIFILGMLLYRSREFGSASKR